MSALLLADTRDGVLLDSTARAMTCARELGGPVHILVLGASSDALTSVRRLGAEKIICATDMDETTADESVAKLLIEMASDYEAIVGAASSSTKSILPRVAAALDVMQVSEVTRVINSRTFERAIYAGNAIQTVESTDKKLILTVRTSTFNLSPMTNANSPVQMLNWQDTTPMSIFKDDIRSTSARPDLASAKIIVSGGRGLQSAELFSEVIESLADKLGAAVGASRAAVDSGYAPNDFQVGQTGKVVAPDLYLAVGISGAIQHLAGMKDSKVIVAINKDAEAPIFQVADFGLVADLFLAVPELKEELSN